MTPSETDILTINFTLGIPNAAFLQGLRPALAQLAITEKTAGMALYMKSSMPFLGVPLPRCP